MRPNCSSLRPTATHERTAALTHRQLEILKLAALGLSNAQIAQRIFVSEATVKWHIKQILSKTNTVNRTEAVARVFGIADSPTHS